MKLIHVALLLLLSPMSLAASGQAPQAGTSPEIRQIEAIVETFRTAIIDKDKARFVALFAPGHVTWQSARGDETVRVMREKDPQAAKVNFDPGKSYLTFIDGIVVSPHSEQEKFWNIRIDTDGDIASVVSDYSFHQGDLETNRGKEAWHLVRTEAGWKIVSVVWSVNRTPPPAAP